MGALAAVEGIVKHQGFAVGLHLPIAEAVTQKFDFLAQSGAGKTYGAMRLAELMLEEGAQVIALDPVGVWWSLRAGADGKSPGFSVVVFGGEHGDLPLNDQAGELVARLIVDKRISAVLDLSGLTTSETKRFVSAFADAFFQAKKRAKSPVHIFFEESQTFAPQVPERDEGVMLNRVERLLKLGRNYGVGWTLISQQPQAVHKRVLNQAGCLVALRTLGKHERKAISEWVSDKATTQQELDLLGELPSLGTGEAFVWSPGWLRVTTRIRITKRVTFDASATPTLGDEKHEAPKKLAAVELAQLREALAQVTAEAEASDPTALQKKVKQLEAELAKAKRAAPAAAPVSERVEIPVLKPEVAQEIRKDLETTRAEFSEAASAAQRKLDAIAAHLVDLGRKFPPAPISRVLGVTRADAAPVVRRTPPPRPESDAALPRGARDMLTALAQTFLPSLSRGQVAMLAGLKVTGGTFAKYLSILKTGGYVETRGDQLLITEAGLDAIGGRPEVPSTTEEIVAMWHEKLPQGARQMLDVLVTDHPGTVSRAALADRVGIEASGGTFAKYLSLLRTSGLVENSGGELVASDTLFPSGADVRATR